MKKGLLLSITILFTVAVHAQAPKGKTIAPNTTTYEKDITSIVKQKTVENGDALIRTESNGVRIYASYKNGKVNNLYTIDKNGRRTNGRYNTSSTTGVEVECFFCVWITTPTGTSKDCTKIPCPEKKQILTRHK